MIVPPQPEDRHRQPGSISFSTPPPVPFPSTVSRYPDRSPSTPLGGPIAPLQRRALHELVYGQELRSKEEVGYHGILSIPGRFCARSGASLVVVVGTLYKGFGTNTTIMMMTMTT